MSRAGRQKADRQCAQRMVVKRDAGEWAVFAMSKETSNITSKLR